MNNQLEKYVLIIATITSFFTVFLSSAVMIAVPTIANEFQMSNIVQNWVTMLFYLSVAVVTIPAGQLSGKYGLKKTMIYGSILFIISSAIILFSSSRDMFLILRIFQGIGAGFLSVASMAMVVSTFKPQDRGKAIGITVTGVYLATSLSPVIGGLLNFDFGWRSLFLFTIPFLILCLFLLITKINKEWITMKNASIDIKGCFSYSLGILLFIYGFSNLNQFQGLNLTIVGIILLIIFAYFELKSNYPAFDIKLFKNIKFSSSNLAALCAYLATFAIVTIVNYNLQYIRGFDSQQSGLILMIAPILQVVIAPIAGRLSDRIDPQKLSALGIGIGSIGLFIISTISEGTSLEFLMIALALQGLGFGIFSSPNTNAIMGAVPPKDTSMASASVATMRVIGQTMSIGMLTLVFAFVMGNVLISPETYHLLIISCQVAAGICTVLCIVSIFLSLIGIKSKDYYDKK